MAIFEKALNPFGKVFGDMSSSGRNNAYANSIMFNAVGNKLREGRKIAAANNLSYGGLDDNGEHIFAPAGVYQPIQKAAEGIAGLLDSRPLPPDMGLTQQEGPRIFPPTHGDPLPPEMLGGPLPGTNLGGTPLPTDRLDYFDNLNPAPIDPINNMYQQPITDDPFQYAQPPDTRKPDVQERDPMTEIPGPGRDPIFFEEVIPDPTMVVEDEVPIEDPVPIGAPIDTGTNPFYAGATNVAQPPSMTPVAPSFGLDVGMGGMGSFNIPTTVPYPTGNYSDQVAVVPYPSTTSTPTSTPTLPNEPQTTATPLPTVNSFAGFSGFGGFGGF